MTRRSSGQFFPFRNRQYFKLYWLYPRRRIWSDFVFVTYSIGGDELSTDNKSISRMKGLSIPDWLQIWLGCTKLQDEQIERFGSSKLRCDYMAAVQDQNRVTSSCRLDFPNVRSEPLWFHIYSILWVSPNTVAIRCRQLPDQITFGAFTRNNVP